MAGKKAYQGAHFAPQAAAPQQKPRKRSKAPLIILIVLILLAAGAAGGFWFWQHRPVNVTVNGESVTVFKRSTLAQLYESQKPKVKAGNLVSVSGKVLEEGTGDPYSATVNGVEASYDDASDWIIWGDENIEFTDGGDAMEEYTTEVEETQPKLEYQVVPGTGEKADNFQQGLVQYISQWGRTGKREIRHGKVSGETADGDVIEEVQNCIVVAQAIHPDNDEKLVALTFDDGPSFYTDDYLSILADHDAKASFFIIGEQVSDGSSVIAQTSEAGHLICSHTWSHLQLPTLEQDELQKEVGDTANALKEIIGKDVMFVRAPYGDMDTNTWLRSGGLMSAAFIWTHDSLDWELPGADAIVANCTANMAPGSVILMHDGGGERDQDVEALPRVIEAWQEAGYKFVTLEELLESDSSINMEAIRAGAMPEDAVWPTELA